MTFGRRLALFFVLIALVPTLALALIVVSVSDDSRRGKADARLAAGLGTALVLYERGVGDAQPDAVRLGRDPALAAAIEGGSEARIESFAVAAIQPPVVGVEVLDQDGASLAVAGAAEAIAFARADLSSGGVPTGALRVSVTRADAYVDDVADLTGDDAIVSRGGNPLGFTATPPEDLPDAGETADLELGGEQVRARAAELDPEAGETLILIGPREEGGLVALEAGAAAILVALLGVGLAFAYVLARTLNRLHARVTAQALTDPLTGLANRRRFERLLRQEVLRAVRFDRELSLLIVDVDDFKQINDERGHRQGDAVLRRLGQLIRETTRAIDIPARYGGDELALILIETDAEGARALADRLRDRVAEHELTAPDGPLRFTISVGAATLPDSAGDAEGLVEAADQALLEAKRRGKNLTISASSSPGGSSQTGG